MKFQRAMVNSEQHTHTHARTHAHTHACALVSSSTYGSLPFLHVKTYYSEISYIQNIVKGRKLIQNKKVVLRR